MFSIFRQKNPNKEEVIEKDAIGNDKTKGNDILEKAEIIPQEVLPEDDIVRDLAVLVGKAITIWEKKYGLENLPRDIALDQAISILEAARDAIK